MNPFRAFKRWRRRREIIRRLVAFAKTKDGRKFIEEINRGNLILADLDAAELGAENPYAGTTLRIRLPNDYKFSDAPRLKQAPEKESPKDHFIRIGDGWLDA